MHCKQPKFLTSCVAIETHHSPSLNKGAIWLCRAFIFAASLGNAGSLAHASSTEAQRAGSVTQTTSPTASSGVSGSMATQAILEKARLKLDSKKNQAHVVMKIIEPGGEIKAREMDIAILQTPNGSRALVKMTAPADSKGTAILAIVENGEQQQWLYLPASKQVRRIASVSKSSGILGSELTAEDMNPDALKDAQVKSISNDGKTAVIRLTPKAGTSDYAYAQTTFDLNDDLPKKTEYFKADLVQKVIEFQDYKTFSGGIARAQKVHITNPVKNRATDIELTDIKTSAKLSDSDFTPQALKNNW